MLTLLWKTDLCSCFRKQQISGQEVQAPSSSRKKPDKCSKSCNCADPSVFWLTLNLLFFFCCSCFNREESIKFIVMGNSWHFIIRMKWLLLFFADLLSFVIINQVRLFSFMSACTSLKKYQKTNKLTQSQLPSIHDNCDTRSWNTEFYGEWLSPLSE